MSIGQPITPTPIQPVQLPPVQSPLVIRPSTNSTAVSIQPSAPIAGVPDIFTQLGFTRVDSFRRLFISCEGDTGTGKTRFLKTCPPPIGVIDFDKGMEGVCEYDVWGNPIVRKSIPLPDFDDRGPEDRRGTSAPAVSEAERSVAVDSYEKFKYIVETLLKGLNGGTLCIDNSGAIYNCAMAARFGQLARLGDVPAQMWRMMKQEFENIFTMAYDYNVNLIVTGRQKAKWGSTTGERTLDGYQEMRFAAQVHLAFEKKMVAPVMSGPILPGAIVPLPQLQFSARVLKCRHNAALEGHEFVAMWLDQAKTQSIGLDFLTIAKAIHPGTTDADWIKR